MIAVITAGGKVDAEFAAEIGNPLKALAPWNDGALIDPAIAAARACGAERIVVIGNAEVKAHCGSRVDEVVPALEDGRTNVQKALTCAGRSESLLFLTSDLPFITPEALRAFLAGVGDAEIAMPLANGGSYEQQFPQAAPHATDLGGERVVNGSVFYFSSGVVAGRAMQVATKLFAARKNLLQMASLVLDAPLILRYATRTLRVSHLESLALRRFDVRVRAVRGSSPTLCYDIDSLADYRYALGYPHGE